MTREEGLALLKARSIGNVLFMPVPIGTEVWMIKRKKKHKYCFPLKFRPNMTAFWGISVFSNRADAESKIAERRDNQRWRQ